MAESKITLFTDGACSGNPGPGGWGAVLVSPLGKVKELGGSENPSTNNRMELTAPLEALRALAKVKTLTTKGIRLYTDSKYVINGITAWIHGWKKRGWKNAEGQDVANREIWEALEAATRGFQVEWLYVPGHQGFAGNERCDEIAVAFAKGHKIDLYEGPLQGYRVNVRDVPTTAEGGAAAKSPGKKGATIYLSYVDGHLCRDQDWKACEARVKGKAGAKFKKIQSPEEEQAILRAWKVSR